MEYPNPEVYEHFTGLDENKYSVHFYRYQEGIPGNIIYNDSGFFPVIIKSDSVVGLGWQEYYIVFLKIY